MALLKFLRETEPPQDVEVQVKGPTLVAYGRLFPFYLAGYEASVVLNAPQEPNVALQLVELKHDQVKIISAEADSQGGVIYERKRQDRVDFPPRTLFLHVHLATKKFA